jgi:hypothetical protein
MSELTSAIRTSRPAPGAFERSAVERARLALVPVRRVNTPRAPFAVLVFLILGAGVVGLLMFNTQMQQDSFYATSLQKQADNLTAQRESLEMQLDALRDPQRLGQAARQLGMVVPPNPTFVDLVTGRIVGTPLVATSDDGTQINPKPLSLPKSLNPPAIIVKVPAEATPKSTPTGQTGAGHGPASPVNGAAAGTNGTRTPTQGAAR